MNKVRSDEKPDYVTKFLDQHDGNKTIQAALGILMARLGTQGDVMGSPTDTRNFLLLRLAEEKDEKFGVMFLNNRHQLIEFKVLFNGTIDGASVHPRVLVREALECNAAAVILAHNHPSGMSEPSKADTQLTRRLVDALGLIDVRVLDHIVIGNMETTSFAERGLI